AGGFRLFFFSGRRRHTRFSRDWSSDVCSSDLDVAQVERHLGLLGGGQQVQDGVGGTAHGDVQGHGVLEGLEVGDRARQHAVVALAVEALAQLDDQAAGAQEQLLAVGVGGQGGAVARQGQAQGLGQAVHGVGG